MQSQWRPRILAAFLLAVALGVSVSVHAQSPPPPAGDSDSEDAEAKPASYLLVMLTLDGAGGANVEAND